MTRARGYGSKFGDRYSAADTEIENNRKAQERASVVGVSCQPRNRRFCEHCKKYKPRIGPAFKGWKCNACKAQPPMMPEQV